VAAGGPECRSRFDRLGLPPRSAWPWAWTASTTPRASWSGSTRWSGCSRSGPQWIGRFVFVQVAAPTRSALDEYRSFQERIDRHGGPHQPTLRSPGYQPVHLLAQHHEHDAVNELFRAADICVVTSLHDGMNLVCKEFVAARDDLQGVLILSRFAGAARELTEALIVNPYHVEETADALHRAATMPAAEQRERMASLRSTVREFNVFRWAGRMLADAGRWRLRERIEARVRGCREQVQPLELGALRGSFFLPIHPVMKPVVQNPIDPVGTAQVLRRFRVVFNAVRSHFQQVEKQVGLGGAQVWALSVVRDHPGIGMGGIAKSMDIHQSTASNLIKTLLRKELISLSRSSGDRRNVHLEILPAGLAVLGQVSGPFEGVLPWHWANCRSEPCSVWITTWAGHPR
jgi:DNA-binding MarR family transcriptional regulator